MKRQMKNSGVQWIGDIPNEWVCRKLKYSLSANDGGVWGDEPQEDGNTFVLRSTEQTIDGKWSIVDPAPRNLRSVSNKDFYLCKEGDLLVTKSSGSQSHIGKTSLVDKAIENLHCCYSNFLQRLHLKDECCEKFFWYILNSNVTRLQFAFMQNATSGLGNINSTDIDNVIIPLPPLPEQKAIADFLDTKCEEIDALLQDLDAEVKTLAEYKKSIIAETVTKGLNHNVPMKSSGIPWIGDIPSHWSISKMQYIAEYLNGYAFKPSDWSEKGLPIIRIQDLTGSNDNPNYFDGLLPERYRVRRGDILISWAATLNSFIWEKEDAWLNQHIFKTQYYKDIVTKNFFFWLTQVVMLNMNNANKHGIMMQHVTTNVFNKFSLPLPPLTEQKAIADYLDKKCAAIEQIITSKLQQIETLKAYKSSLIYEYVTGKKQVPV